MKSLVDQLLNQASKYVDGSSQSVSKNTDLLKGVVGGGLVGAILGNKKSRKLATKYGKKAAVVGGTAVVGTLAYQAYKQWKQGETTGATTTLDIDNRQLDAPTGAMSSQIDPSLLIKAMVFAAKADGHIDDNEKRAITEWMHQQQLGNEVELLISRWIDEPLDPNALAADVKNLEQAAEVYLVSILAIDVDHFLEKAYLEQLAQSLSLPQDLIWKIEEQVNL